MKKGKRAKHIEQAILLTMDSLQSHLPCTYGKSKDGRKFHKKCVKEYIKLLTHISNLY